MKKLFFIFLILIFASSASATVYKWVDERGMVNFADDYSKVPPRFQNNVEEMRMPKMSPPSTSKPSGKTIATQPPPVSQNLVREGDFAVKLVEALRMGQAKNEAEAESMLASAGIAPKNGWIADYPVTPDIIGELENAVGEAANARKLSMAKNDALKALRTTAVEFELPIIAEIPEGYTESPPPTTPEYAEPSVIDNYYNTEGPPVITYYPPPWDYYYMYAWVPTPFWCSGFYFPGFFILHDFHRFHHGHGHPYLITNHFRDQRTGRMVTIDPARRHEGRSLGVREPTGTKGFSSTEARNGARSIFERSRERAGSQIPSAQTSGRENRNPASSQNRRGNEKQGYNRQSNSPSFNNQNGNNSRPSVNDRRIDRTPGQGRMFSRPESMNRQSGINVQRYSTGQNQLFHPPSSQGSGRIFSLPQGGGQHLNPSPGGGLSGPRQGGGGGFSGFHQGAGGGGFGRGGGFRF